MFAPASLVTTPSAMFLHLTLSINHACLAFVAFLMFSLNNKHKLRNKNNINHNNKYKAQNKDCKQTANYAFSRDSQRPEKWNIFHGNLIVYLFTFRFVCNVCKRRLTRLWLIQLQIKKNKIKKNQNKNKRGKEKKPAEEVDWTESTQLVSWKLDWVVFNCANVGSG